MAYYQYLVSVTTPSASTRSSSTSRSASVDRYTSGYSSSSALDSRRFARASTVGRSLSVDRDNVAYYGYMPFSRQLSDIESRMRSRREMESVRAPVDTYRRAFTSRTFDTKVSDYANRLDFEETTRNYINSCSSCGVGLQENAGSMLRRPSSFSRSYDRAASPSASTYSRTYSSDYNSIDGLYSYKHFRKSNATLVNRNSRAKSPIQGRELDRYYKTERRSDYMGDVSSGGVRDFRFYNYRSVPYFGGSDYYSLSTKQLQSV